MKAKHFQDANIHRLAPEQIKQWRKENKLSMRKLSRIMGINNSTAWRWEHGYHPAPVYLSLVFKGIEYLSLHKKSDNTP